MEKSNNNNEKNSIQEKNSQQIQAKQFSITDVVSRMEEMRNKAKEKASNAYMKV